MIIWVWKLKAGIRNTYNLQLSSINEEFPLVALHADVLEGEVLMKLKWIFISDDVRDMLESKFYQCIDTVFGSFVDITAKVTGYFEYTKRRKQAEYTLNPCSIWAPEA